jgi:hypothetical protein
MMIFNYASTATCPTELIKRPTLLGAQFDALMAMPRQHL